MAPTIWLAGVSLGERITGHAGWGDRRAGSAGQ
jgi:hypothetical protein